MPDDDRAPLHADWRIVGGLRLHARASDAAPGRPPVVLVHGLGVSGRYYVPAARALAVDHAVWVPDLPGHGRSEAPPRAQQVPEMADTLLAWMDAVGLERPALVGNSLGCQAVLHLAARHPERAGPLVLVGPTVDSHHRTLLAQFARLVATGLFERAALLPILALDYARMLPRVAGEVRAALDDRPEANAPLVRSPSLIVRGEHDLLTTRAWVAELAALLRGETVRELRGVGHAVHFSVPDRFAAIVRDFLRAAAAAEGQPRSRSSSSSMSTASSASSSSSSESSASRVIS